MEAVESPNHVSDEHDDESCGGECPYVVGAPDADELWEKGYAAKNRIRFCEAIDGVIVFARGLLFLADKVQHGESIAY